MVNVPIPVISDEQKKPFIEKADEMLTMNKELQEINGKFIRMLNRKFDIEPNKALSQWHTHDYKTFAKELSKALAKTKNKLTLAEEAEWEDYFTTEQQKAQTLQTKIHQTDQQINQMVYELYGLNEEEIKVVEGG